MPGGLPAQGGLVWGGGSPCRGGLHARGGGRFSMPGGSPSLGGSPCWGGGVLLARPPPVNRMTDRCKNITLAKTSFQPVNILVV